LITRRCSGTHARARRYRMSTWVSETIVSETHPEGIPSQVGRDSGPVHGRGFSLGMAVVAAGLHQLVSRGVESALQAAGLKGCDQEDQEGAGRSRRGTGSGLRLPLRAPALFAIRHHAGATTVVAGPVSLDGCVGRIGLAATLTHTWVRGMVSRKRFVPGPVLRCARGGGSRRFRRRRSRPGRGREG
jgi:hypothetical protein